MRIGITVAFVLAVAGCVALAAPAAAAQSQPAAAEVYRVAPGDTLWSLARRFGTTPDRLAAMNGISPEGILSIGQHLKVPAQAAHQPALLALDETGDGAVSTIYRIQPGDTLWSVSRRFGTKPDRLAAMNRISTEGILKIGQELKVRALPGALSGPTTRPALPSPDARAARDAAMRARLAAMPSRGEHWASGLVALSTRQVGVRYRWGGTTPAGFDCSGFLYYVFGQMGITLPRTTYAMSDAGVSVPRDELQTGDIVFFQTLSPGPSHAGVYLGGGHFIHSSSGAGRVLITSMDDPYYAPRYLGARRF